MCPPSAMVSVACGLIFVSCGECQSSVSLARAKMSTVSNRGVVGGWIAAFAVVAIVAGERRTEGKWRAALDWGRTRCFPAVPCLTEASGGGPALLWSGCPRAGARSIRSRSSAG